MNRLAAFAVLAVAILVAGVGALLYRASTSPSSVQVSISNYSFSPSTLNVQVGTIVRWVNFDSVGHTVTFGGQDSIGSGMDSGLMGHMKSFTTTFTEPGVHEYHCDPHPYMTGAIIVSG